MSKKCQVPLSIFSYSSAFLQHITVLTTLIPLDSLFSLRLQNITLSWFSFSLFDCPFTKFLIGYSSSTSISGLFLSPFYMLCFVCSSYSLHGQLYPLLQIQLTLKLWIYWWLTSTPYSFNPNLLPKSQSHNHNSQLTFTTLSTSRTPCLEHNIFPHHKLYSTS